ncbi:hypothetical protein M9H77_35969 [Catharanthus roseus]|uniref:Uncharacterized protein n=1 Tax=Catharanthus roseus TaxID=4058 RepID=A0ACB9ZS97_CATRO|nr:hypothetical protein M9H77_35969 [Catharanthus roseus]
MGFDSRRKLEFGDFEVYVNAREQHRLVMTLLFSPGTMICLSAEYENENGWNLESSVKGFANIDNLALVNVEELEWLVFLVQLVAFLVPSKMMEPM